MSKSRILLVEPDYKNKYPPIGLMKLATYHRNRGDEVEFFKGNLKNLFLNRLTQFALKKLNVVTRTKDWNTKYRPVYQYIKRRRLEVLEILISSSEKQNLVEKWLRYFAKCHLERKYPEEIKYDRVYVTTLFTFYWKMTIDTINFAKLIAKEDGLLVGGIMASLVPEEIKKETGVSPIVGLLDKPGQLDKDTATIIDKLPLDYSILEEIDYKYPANNAYYGYMTRGCVRNCEFCSVPQIEPRYKPYLPIVRSINHAKRKYGPRKNLLLLDNNVLASREFPKIINGIQRAGFSKGATFIKPNDLEYAVKNLSYNERGYRKKATELILNLKSKLKNDNIEFYQKVLDESAEYEDGVLTSKSIRHIYKELKELYESYRNVTPKMRFIDFNQGVDARLLNEEKMKLLSTIAIRPLRIAFDTMALKDKYIAAVKLAAKYNIRNLSNYLLYNFKDTPENLYRRMRINIDLCEELKINIYSFPMKYNPVNDNNGYHKNRNYLGKYWNRKFVRSIQAILNATKGKVGRGRSFFDEAFGANLDEYKDLLYMPETYIIYRFLFKGMGLTKSWKQAFHRLTDKEKTIALPIIEGNKFADLAIEKYSKKIQRVLCHYLVTRDHVESGKVKSVSDVSAIVSV